MGLKTQIVLRLFHKLRQGLIQLSQAKAEALKAKCEDRAISAWLLDEDMETEEELKEKYGDDIFEDTNFIREASQFKGHIRRGMPIGFRAFIENRKRMLRLPQQAETEGWKQFLAVRRKESDSTSSSAALVADVWLQKRCSYKIFHGTI